jgi:5-methylcytosine-specific restriction endonuclease McrA
MVLDNWDIWPKILLRDRLQCVYCGLDGNENVHIFRQLVTTGLDHLVPRSAGGPHTEENLVISCWPCNKAKSSFDPRYDGMPIDPEQRRLALIERARQHIKGIDWDYYRAALDELHQMRRVSN